MARRNRKKRKDGFVFPAPLAVALAVLAGLSLLYLWLNVKTDTLGLDIKALEVKGEALRARLIKEQCEWAQMQSPANMEKALRNHGLVMTWPNMDQVVMVRADGSVIEGLAGKGRSPGSRQDCHE